jgi:predicted ThiF/HesA family dinucleotide-utilizing enzyme
MKEAYRARDQGMGILAEEEKFLNIKARDEYIASDNATTHTQVDTNFALVNTVVVTITAGMDLINKADVIDKGQNEGHSTVSINYDVVAPKADTIVK